VNDGDLDGLEKGVGRSMALALLWVTSTRLPLLSRANSPDDGEIYRRRWVDGKKKNNRKTAVISYPFLAKW
jgi:hypothetical protein